jgi:hypothetical protein
MLLFDFCEGSIFFIVLGILLAYWVSFLFLVPQRLGRIIAIVIVKLDHRLFRVSNGIFKAELIRTIDLGLLYLGSLHDVALFLGALLRML